MTIGAWLAAALAVLSPASSDRDAIATAIADVVERRGPIFAHDAEGKRTAATLATIARFESNFDLNAVGDHGRSVGAFQCLNCGRALLGDAPAQVERAYSQLADSIRRCPSHPLAIYSRGHCSSVRGREISDARMRSVDAMIRGAQ